MLLIPIDCWLSRSICKRSIDLFIFYFFVFFLDCVMFFVCVWRWIIIKISIRFLFGPNQIWLIFTLIFVYFSLVSRFFRVIRFLCFEMSSFSFVLAPMHFKSESNLLFSLYYSFCNLKSLKMYKNAFGFIDLVHPKWHSVTQSNP